MYELEQLVEGVFFEVLNQERDSVGVGPCFAAVVAGSEPVGVVSLIDKGAVGFNELAWNGKGGEDGFVDDPLLGGVIGNVVDCDKVIEGFDQFSFRLGGVEVVVAARGGDVLLSRINRLPANANSTESRCLSLLINISWW
jgi:hypothetical protein